VFGTTRTFGESLLDIGEGIIAIFIAAGLTYLVARWIWPTIIEWWEQRSRQSAAKAAAKLDSQIKILNESKTDLFLRQTMLSGAIHYSLNNQIAFFGWMILGFMVGIGGSLLGRPYSFRLAAGIFGGISASLGLITNFRWNLQRPKVEDLVKLDEYLIKLERRRETLSIRAELRQPSDSPEAENVSRIG